MSFTRADPGEKRALKNAYKRLYPILIVAIIVFSLLVSYIHFLNQREEIVDMQQKLITDAVINYNNYISNLISITRSIETNYIESATLGYPKNEIEIFFIKEMIKNPVIDQLRILDLYGMETIRVDKELPIPYAIPESELQNKSDRYYYPETKLLGRNQFLLSAIDLNIEHSEIEIDPKTYLTKPILRISAPVVLGERRTGYFIVNFLMRDYLSYLRTSSNITGGYILLFDQNGYMLNYENDSYNFGFSYDEGSEEHSRTIKSIFPDVDLTQETDVFVEDDKISSYAAYDNIEDLSDNYFLSDNASEKLYFMVYFDKSSIYGKHIQYSPVTCTIGSWEMQLVMLSLVIPSYFILTFLYFLMNRVRFTNRFTDNRYKKSRLKKALKNHEFVNYYQPVINIQNGTLMGCEALSRWKRKDTVLTPDMFMGEINRYELSVDLDENAFRNIRRDRQKMEGTDVIGDAYISINISRQTFEYMTRKNSRTIIKLTDEEKKYIVLELLEDIVFYSNLANKIRDLHDDNVLFAIDDFGTGNSNVAFIRSFKNMEIKIDKAFVPNDVHNKEECIIIESFVKMFSDQGFEVIVEGVETKEQYLYLKGLNVTGVQGYYFSKPLPLNQFIEYVKNKDYSKKIENSL